MDITDSFKGLILPHLLQTHTHTEINKFLFRGKRRIFMHHKNNATFHLRACLGLLSAWEPEKGLQANAYMKNCRLAAARGLRKRQKFLLCPSVCPAVINHPRNGACVGRRVHCSWVNGAKRFGETKNMQWGAVNDAGGQKHQYIFTIFLNLFLGPEEPSVP